VVEGVGDTTVTPSLTKGLDVAETLGRVAGNELGAIPGCGAEEEVNLKLVSDVWFARSFL